MEAPLPLWVFHSACLLKESGKNFLFRKQNKHNLSPLFVVCSSVGKSGIWSHNVLVCVGEDSLFQVSETKLKKRKTSKKSRSPSPCRSASPVKCKQSLQVLKRCGNCCFKIAVTPPTHTHIHHLCLACVCVCVGGGGVLELGRANV